MPKKKRFFNKNNSVKYRLLPGNAQACNAEGEVLPTLLIPIPHGSKKGASLLFSNLQAVGGQEHGQSSSSGITFLPLSYDEAVEFNGRISGVQKREREPDLAKIMEDFDDDGCEVDDEEDEDESEDDPDSTSFMTQWNNLNISSQKELESKFVNCVPEPVENDESDDYYDDDDGELSYSSDISDELSDAGDFKQKHSKYLVSSARENCPESIKTFNERFEKIFETYDDDQIGALDDEEICGHLSTNSALLGNYVDAPNKATEDILELGCCDSTLKEQILNYAEQDEDEKYIKIVMKAPVEFDCESILSTYSNIYNHPTVIKEERSKIKKIKIPDNPLKRKLVKSHLKQLDRECDDKNSEEEESEDDQSVITNYNMRLKGETPEQRRERKNLFKEAKRESRMLKKENKLAFKNEKKIQKAQIINSNQNRGIRLL